MTRLVYIQHHANGPRVYVVGQRLHHGATGCVLALALVRNHRLRVAAAVAGAALAIHDRRDVRIWFVREGLPHV